MLEITSLRVNHQLLGEELRTHFCTAKGLSFSWGVCSGKENDKQASCRVLVSDESSLLWDSGIVETDEQLIHYAGSKLPEGRRHNTNLRFPFGAHCLRQDTSTSHQAQRLESHRDGCCDRHT